MPSSSISSSVFSSSHPTTTTTKVMLMLVSSVVAVSLLLCQCATLAMALPQELPELQQQIITVNQPLPKLAAQYDYFGGRGTGGTTFGGFGGGNGAYNGNSGGGDTVNFDFQCKCQSKSALARNLLNTQTSSTAPGTDPHQQQIVQLREQIQKLQSQIDRSQQGKSSFEQFAQMLAMADGLDCNCSGQSTPWSGWPSGVSSSSNGMGMMGGGGNNNNNGAIPNNPFGGVGTGGNSNYFPGARGNLPFGGGSSSSLSQMLGGYGGNTVGGGHGQYPFQMGSTGAGSRLPMMMGGGGGYPFMMGPVAKQT